MELNCHIWATQACAAAVWGIVFLKLFSLGYSRAIIKRRGLGFPQATFNMAPGYQKKSLAD